MNPVQPQEILDFNGVSSKIREVKGEIKDFGTEAQKLISILSTETNKYGKEIAALIEALKKIKVTGDPSAPLSDGAKRIKEIADATKILTQAQQDLANAGKLSTTALKELEAEQKQITQAYKTLISEQGKESEQAKVLEQRLAQLSEKANLLNGQLRQAKKATQEATGSYNELQKSLSKDIAELKKLEGVFTTTNGKVVVNKQKIDELTKSINQKNQALKDVDKQMGFNQRNVGNYSSAMAFLNGGMRGLIGSAGAVGIAILALGEVYSNVLQPMIAVTSQFERFDITIKNVSGSLLENSLNNRFVNQTANRLGLEIFALGEGFKILAGATEGTALAGAKTRDIFESVSEAAASMRASGEETTSMLRAFGQMVSKGTLQSEELKGQLAEHLPQALRITAQEYKVTTDELLKMIKNSEIFAIEALPKIAKGLENAFSEEAKNNINTIEGATNSLTNKYKEFVAAIINESPFKTWYANATNYFSKGLETLTMLYKSGSGIFELVSDPQLALKKMASFEAEKRQTDLLLSFSKLSADKRLKVIDEFQTKSKGKETDYLNKLKEIHETEVKRQLDADKELADRKLKAQQEAQEKANKKAAAQREKDLAEQRRLYQVKLREIDANEKTALYIVETKNVEGTISDEQFAKERLDITSKFLTQKKNLITEFSKGELSIAESLIDDKARLETEGQKNQLDSTKIRIEALKNMYNDYLEEQRRLLTVGNADLAKEIKISFDQVDEEVEKNQQRLAKSKAKDAGAIRKNPLLNYNYDIASINIDIQGIQDKLMKVNLLDAQARQKIEDRYKETTDKISKLGVDSLFKEEKLKQASVDRDIALDKLKGDSAVRLAELHKRLAEARTEIEKEELRKQIDQEQLAYDKKQAMIQASFDLAQELSNTIGSIAKSRSEYEINNLEKQKDYEVSMAGDNAEARIRIEQDYNKKIAELKRKQAIADKVQALFSIALNTAQGVTSALAKTVTAPLVPFILAAGALQAATVIATPIPEFAKGKKRGDSYKGLGIVGEAGTEIVERDGKKSMVDKPTLTYLDPKTTVYTARETERMINDSKNMSSSTNAMRNIEYNHNFVNKSIQFKQAQSTMKGIDFNDKNVTDAINKGFDGINIWLSNDDGSTTRKRGNSIVKDNTNRTIYYK